jgi:hypothetical protein
MKMVSGKVRRSGLRNGKNEAYHRFCRKRLDLFDRARSSLLESYAMNLFHNCRISLPSNTNAKSFSSCLALDELHKTDCVWSAISTYSLVEVDCIFAGDHVGDGASLGGLGLARGGCFWCHCLKKNESVYL